MNNIREKLVELLDEARAKRREICYAHTDCNSCVFGEEGENCGDKMIADHLIANGVTVQEWIPVSEPPKEWEEVFVYIPSLKMTTKAKMRGGSWYSTWDSMRLDYVTHWMPMPAPPKGE